MNLPETSLGSKKYLIVGEDTFYQLLKEAWHKVTIKDDLLGDKTKNWLDNNLRGMYHRCFDGRHSYYFFESEEDAVEFALTFLEENV